MCYVQIPNCMLYVCSFEKFYFILCPNHPDIVEKRQCQHDTFFFNCLQLKPIKAIFDNSLIVSVKRQ